MPADFDSVFGDDDFNFDDDPIEDGDDLAPAPQDEGFEDMFRQQAERTETSFDEMEADEEEYFETEGNSGGVSLGSFSSFQRLVIIALVLLDLFAIGYGVLILAGRVG